MRFDIFKLTGGAMAAGAFLALAGCGGGDEAPTEAADNGLGNDAILQGVGNDASAMEAAGVASDSSTGGPTGNGSDAGTGTGTGTGSEDAPVLGNTSGGDTGGNSADSNVSGM